MIKNKWLEINKKYAEIWPNIYEKKAALPEAEKYKDITNKYPKDFSEEAF